MRSLAILVGALGLFAAPVSNLFAQEPAPRSWLELVASGTLTVQFQNAVQLNYPPVRTEGLLTFYTVRADFEVDFPGLTVEDFEEANVAAGAVATCQAPIDENSNDGCFSPGDIIPGVQFQDNPGPDVNDYVALGAGVFGNPGKVIGPNTFADNNDIIFPIPAFAAGMNMLNSNATTVTVEIYGVGNVLLGSTTTPASVTGEFFGVASDQTIERIHVISPDGDLVDNVSFSAQAPRPGANPDFSAGPFIDLPDTVFAGVVINVKAKITNLGNMLESNVPVRFFEDSVEQGTVNVTLDTLESDTVSFAWTPGVGASYNLKIQTFLPTDSVPANDSVTVNVVVLEKDYSVDAILDLPTDANAGQPVLVKALVSNNGPSDETGVPVKLLVDGGESDTIFMSVTAGATDTAMFTWIAAGGSLFGTPVELTVQVFLPGDDLPANDAQADTVNVFTGVAVNPVFFDDFSAGAGNWTISNDGGTCVWEVLDIAANFYTLPPEASGNILAADADLCGNGTTLLSTATLTNTLDLSAASVVTIQFDSDWRHVGPKDIARVEVSNNNGSSWSPVLEYAGVSARERHEALDVGSVAAGSGEVKVRLVSIQPDWDWWWAIDNFEIAANDSVVSLDDHNTLPDRFALHQNYPNPFNPATTIAYNLKADSRVVLNVYNVLGQEVRSLVNARQTAGKKEIVWDGRNNIGQAVSSGVYIYRIEAGNFVQSRKMMFLK